MTDQTQIAESEIPTEIVVPQVPVENGGEGQEQEQEQKITSKQFGLKLNKYFAIGCGMSIFWYSYKIYEAYQERFHLKKQLVYSPSIIQQSNRKLNDYLNTLTGQIKDFMKYSEEQNNLESYQLYGKFKEKLEQFEGGFKKQMKFIDESIQKYYQPDSVGEYEHIPVTFVKENDKTTVRLNGVLVMGTIGLPEPNHAFLGAQDKSESLLYKRNFKEKMYLNNMLQSRQNPIYNVKEQFVNSFQLNDQQKEMQVIVNNFSHHTIITDDCLDHNYREKDIMKLEKEVGILFACSLLLSPFPFYNGIQIGVQDSEIGIKARGVFCLLGDLIFDQQTQSFRMDNPQFIARSKQAIVDYLNNSISLYQNKLKTAIYGLTLSAFLYYALTHKEKIASICQRVKNKVKQSFLYIYNNIL